MSAKAMALAEEAMRREEADLAVLLAARSYLWRVFHLAFGGHPSDALVEELASERMRRALGLFGEGDEVLQKAIVYLGGLGARALGDAGHTSALDGEYMRLFVGPGELACPPWESYYVEDDRALFSATTLSVRTHYRSWGLLPARYPKVSDDHAAMMSEYLARLGTSAMLALRAGDYSQAAQAMLDSREFLASHMTNWTPLWAKAARHAKTMLLYPQLIQAFDAFAQQDSVLTGEAFQWLGAASHEKAPGSVIAAEASEFLAAAEELGRMKLLGLDANSLAENIDAER